MVFSSSMPRRTIVSRHISSRYGISAEKPGMAGCRSQSITGDAVMIGAALHLHQKVAALDLHLEHLQILFGRGAQRLAGLHIESGGVQRTFNAAILQPAIR